MSIKCRRGSVLWRDICDFFLSFRLKTAFSLRAFGVFVSTQEREREKNVSFREEQTLSCFCFSFSRRRRCPFFSQKENKQSSFLSFAFTQERLAF